jgi:hypothetical protein
MAFATTTLEIIAATKNGRHIIYVLTSALLLLGSTPMALERVPGCMRSLAQSKQQRSTGNFRISSEESKHITPSICSVLILTFVWMLPSL